MLCQNCGKNEANIKYTQIINGVKKQMSLCSNCAEELGIEDIGFDMPIDFSSFLSDIFEDTTSIMPDIINTNEIVCDKCNLKYNEFIEVGKFGCEHCYEQFQNKINPLLKSIQGSNEHIGRLENRLVEDKYKQDKKVNSNINKEVRKEDEKENSKENKLKELQERLKQEIIDERYEDAAKTRDEIKKLQGKL